MNNWQPVVNIKLVLPVTNWRRTAQVVTTYPHQLNVIFAGNGHCKRKR